MRNQLAQDFHAQVISEGAHKQPVTIQFIPFSQDMQPIMRPGPEMDESPLPEPNDRECAQRREESRGSGNYRPANKMGNVSLSHVSYRNVFRGL